MIRHIRTLLFGATAVLLGKPAHVAAHQLSKGSPAYGPQIDSITQSRKVLGSKWGIELVDVKTGKVMYARNPNALFNPASNMKLLTALVGLAQLGPDHKVEPWIGGGVIRARGGDAQSRGNGVRSISSRFLGGSESVGDLVVEMLKDSRNDVAERLFLATVVAAKERGTREEAVANAYRWLKKWRIRDSVLLRDGSGLDKENRLSAASIVALLSHALSETHFSVFYDALAVGGVDGTLRERFPEGSPAHGIHAKTGSLERVRTLSGYFEGPGGRRFAFSILCNGYRGTNQDAERAVDAVAERLALMVR
jgi:D-alanyl-D-alanine carboxypeptidase